MAEGNSASPIASVLERLTAEAVEAKTELEGRKQTLVSQLAEVNEELRILNRVMNAASRPSDAARKQVQRRAKGESTQRPEATEAVRQAIAKAGGEFSISSLLENNPELKKDQIEKALSIMREGKEIRFIGERRSPNQKLGKGRKTYALVS